jgi:DNA-nicking Smr family endonuclease
MSKHKGSAGTGIIRASIDLHGKTVEQAEPLIDQFIHRLADQSGGRARIIVGKGTGAIKNFTTSYLKRAGYSFEFERLSSGQRNDGVIVIFLD